MLYRTSVHNLITYVMYIIQRCILVYRECKAEPEKTPAAGHK